MEKVLYFITAFALSLGFSSCSGMFRSSAQVAKDHTEIHRVKAYHENSASKVGQVGGLKNNKVQSGEKQKTTPTTATTPDEIKGITCRKNWCHFCRGPRANEETRAECRNQTNLAN
jgi:hypothetical protein